MAKYLFSLSIAAMLVPLVYCVSVPSNIQKDSTADELSLLESKISKLQVQMKEIYQSFKTLKLIENNPSLLAERPEMKSHLGANAYADVHDRHRHRRQVESSTPSNGQSGFDGASNTGQVAAQNFLGPYSYPMFSGQCFLCPAGQEGPRGPSGPQGLPGRDGRDGRDTAPPAESDEEQPQPTPQTTPVVNVNVSGVVYTRWGNSECPDGSELVYAGTVAGSHYTHVGGGSNYLCMPSEPIYDEYLTSASTNRALVYSAEYQIYDAPGRMTAVHNHSPTCAVCRAPPGRTTKLVIPARNECPSSDWRLEYGGYLMSERYLHKRSEFICVDRDMETEPSTQGDENGALLYLTEVRCLAGGGLPCGPYVEGYELTCAVCTI